MSWWMWLIIGFALLGGEILTPGFVLLFFGAAAVIVGVINGLGIDMPDWADWLVFAGLSLVLLGLFRSKMRELLQPGNGSVDALAGQNATVTEAMLVQAFGKVELRGSSWKARNIGVGTLQIGDRCRVEKVEGLMLLVKSEE